MLAKLRESVSLLETQMAVLRATVATKEDLHKELHAATTKYVGWMFVLLAAFTGIVTAIRFLWPNG